MESIKDAADELTYGIRSLCGKPTPLKRLVIVLAMCGILSIVFIYTTVTSIYSIARNDAEKEFFNQGHVRRLELKNDSILLNQHDVPKDAIRWEKVK